MYPDWACPAAAGFLTLWLTVLSFLIWKQGNFLNALFPKSGERDIRKKFGEVINAVGHSEQGIGKLEERLLQLDKEVLKHIQRVDLIRYNPYEDTGGNISFSLALLDALGDGFVLTSLHARGGTRVFAKPVVSGKGQKQQLSNEEQEVVDKALKQK